MNNPPQAWANWYPPPAAPQGYYPYAAPHGGYQWGQPAWNVPQQVQQSNQPKVASGFKSAKYPTLNPILAADTTLVRFDVSIQPSKSINTTTFMSNRTAPVIAGGCHRIRLVSKAFPWTIELQGQNGVPLTCEDLWNALYEALQQHIVDSEWGMLVLGDKKKKELVEKSMKKRCDKDIDSFYKRIDFLGENTLFKGLEKDDEYVKSRIMKGVENVAETWVVKIA